MSGLAGKATEIALGLIVVAAITPTALVMIANATLTGVDAAVVTIFQVALPIVAIIATVLYFLPRRA
jgi:hypothetical protein